MKLVIEGADLKERLERSTLNSSHQGDTCDSHDGCGEQCNHSYCRY
jgi:hypothetical protein